MKAKVTLEKIPNKFLMKRDIKGKGMVVWDKVPIIKLFFSCPRCKTKMMLSQSLDGMGMIRVEKLCRKIQKKIKE